MNSLSSSRTHYEFTIFFADPLWIYFFLRKLTIYLLREFAMIHLIFRLITLNFLSFCEFTINSLSHVLAERNGIFKIGQFWTLSFIKGRLMRSIGEIARQPLRTFNDLIWPQLILNFNRQQNSESKHIYIWYISTDRPDLTTFWRIWPKFDLWWP